MGQTGRLMGGQVGLPEHGEETEGEAHSQGWTKVPQVRSEVTDVMKKWRKDGQMLQGWGSHGDVGCSEQTGHLVVLQGHWSATYLLVEGPDSGDVIVNTPCH